MTASTEGLAARVERLERLLRERGMDTQSSDERTRNDVHRFWAHIPFGAWLKISGPTFAVMALGFGTLWNAQQATTQQILELQESMTDRILQVQESTTDRILEMQESTTDRILEMQRSTSERILEMQQQILDLNRVNRTGNG